MGMAKLIGVSENLKGQTFPLSGPKVTVGRLPENAVCLTHEMISSRHAELYQDKGQWYVRDLRATNGTFVNGARVENAPVYDGDSVRFGFVTLKFVSDATALNPPTESPKQVVALSDTSVRTTPLADREDYVEMIGGESSTRKLRRLMFAAFIVVGFLLITLLAVLIVRLIRT
jgi:pSer/pThr/pTyr-binding forkhead associated (FHA) protein